MSHQLGASRGQSTDRTRRELFAWSLLAAVLLFAALAGPFFARRIYVGDDLGAFHLPIRAFYAQQLARGEPFDWMPHLFSGFYLTGEGQGGTYHPWHLLLYSCLPLRVALGAEWLATYPFMLVGTWLFLRRRLNRSDAAMLGSLMFTFSGFNLLHFIHPNAVAVVAHVPWLLWAIDVALVDDRPGRAASAQATIALLTGSQLLLGYPQYVWFSLLTEAAYAAFVLTSRRGTAPCAARTTYTGTPWCRPIIAKGCGLLLGGVQLLPTIDALAHAARRSADTAFADWGSLHPWNLIQLLAPYLFTHRVVGQNTHELGLYAGAVPLMLIIWLVVSRRKLGALTPFACATGGFGVLALLLAFGKHGQLYRLQRHLPLVGHFRFPSRYVVLVHLAVAVLAAMGFVLLVREFQRQRSSRQGKPWDRRSVWAEITQRRFYPLWIAVALSAAAALAGLVFQGRPFIAPVYLVLIGPLLTAAAAGLVVFAASGVRAALIGLILLAAADLGCYGLTYAVYPHTARLDHYVASASTPPAQAGDARGGNRLVADMIRCDERKAYTGNQITLAGWRRADGYLGLEPQRRLDYRRLPALRAAGVRWVKRGETTAEVEGLTVCNEDWMAAPQPMARVRLVTRAVASDDPARDIERIELESTALTEIPLSLPPAEPGMAELVEERPGHLLVRSDCSTPQLMVVSESYHDGWQATVDGRPQQVLRVNGDFIGCPVGPGKQTVVFEFRPGSLRRGQFATGVGLALILVCFAGGRFAGRSRHAENERP